MKTRPVSYLLSTLILLPAAAPAATEQRNLEARVQQLEERVGIDPGGGGAYIRDDDLELRLLGYVQGQLSAFDGSLRPATARDFSVRRARIDFMLDLYEQHELFVEFDGAPDRTALVEARMNWELHGKALQLRAGKFTSQFSTENARSSRAIDTVERYLALNSLFLLPALDTQFGGMLHGRTGSSDRVDWSLGLYNGNSSANANVDDDNNDKEIQLKLGYDWTDSLSTRVALDYSEESAQELSLVDAGFNRFVTVPVEGSREGVGADLHWHSGPWHLRAEGLAFRFDGVREDQVGLVGGFVQPSWFIRGNHERGLEMLLRLETSHLDAATGADGDAVHAATLGLNWFVNPNVRLQTNVIGTHFNGPSSEQGFDHERTQPSWLTQLQFKF